MFRTVFRCVGFFIETTSMLPGRKLTADDFSLNAILFGFIGSICNDFVAL